MKRNKIIGIILITIGFFVSAYPLVIQKYADYQQKLLVEAYGQILSNNITNQTENSNQIESNTIDAGINKANTNVESIGRTEQDIDIEIANSQSNEDDIMNPENIGKLIDKTSKDEIVEKESLLSQLKQSLLDSLSGKLEKDAVEDLLSRQEILGLIEIEKISINKIIVEGTGRENIRLTIGHMIQSKSIGEDGNCALAGHRGGTYGTFFKNIDQLEVDDEIKITNMQGEEYIYKVYEQLVTEATDMEVISDISGEKTLTLISCEDNGTKRLIIHARMED